MSVLTSALLMATPLLGSHMGEPGIYGPSVSQGSQIGEPGIYGPSVSQGSQMEEPGIYGPSVSQTYAVPSVTIRTIPLLGLLPGTITINC
jgi:hypothetical protein